MPLTEPTTIAVLLLVVGVLLVVSALFSRAASRVGVPGFLIFLAVGMLAGSEGIGGIPFEDYRLSFRLGTIALALILFDGGLNTPLVAVRRVAWPAGVLATAGVAGTAVVMASGARLLGLPWPTAMLLGAVVSSTDAAAVFAVLRSSGLKLKRRVGAMLEVESGVNDPLAVLLTLAAISLAAGEGRGWALTLLALPLQLAIGAAVGWGIGAGGRALLRRARMPAGGLYAVVTLAVAFVAFSLATLVWGSGFLAVYVAGMVLGNGDFPYKSGLKSFHDAAAWLSQVSMFLLLGLLVFPSRLVDIAPLGLALGLFLAFVARPLVVSLCLLPFRYPWRESLYISWVGLRGAVPIILATMPVLAGVPAAESLFDLVFFVVVTTALVPGGTVGWATRRLGLASAEPAPPPAALEINSLVPLAGEILGFTIAEPTAACGATIAQLPFPPGASAMLLLRGDELIAPKGDTRLEAGDHLFVFGQREDRAFLELLFGHRDEEGA